MAEGFRLREACWVFGETLAEPLAWAAGEAETLAAALTGAAPRRAEAPAGAAAIVVGSPAGNSWIRAAGLPELADGAGALGPDDYLLRAATLDGRPVLYIAGRTDRAAMYGLFAFFETLGCAFLLSGDVLPDPDPALLVPPLETVGRTRCPWRGFWISHCFATIGLLSLPDYARMFDQMAKMRLNRVIYYPFENEPWVDYTYAGERKVVGDATHPESGCLALGRGDIGSYRVSDMAVGAEAFDRPCVAPREFQGAQTSDALLDAGRDFLRELIRLARARGIGSWLSFDLAFIALNFAKYLRRMPRPVDLYSTLVSFTDPVAREINRARIASVIDAYPELEGIFFQITEGFYEDRHPESRAVIAAEWENYREALALLRAHWDKWWVGEEIQETCLRADIGFVELLKQGIADARALKPELPLGVLTVCKAYLLTRLHEILPRDIPFVDIEAQSLWTVDGAPLHLFDRMAGRACALAPRAYDDGSLAGLQCNLRLYDRDGFLAAPRAHGTAGLVVQVSHLTGNDHNVRYLAAGMWDDTLTPARCYREYAAAVVGAAAAPAVVEAFAELEENEVFLGGRGLKNLPYTFSPPEVRRVEALREHPKPFLEAGIAEAELADFDARAARFRQARGSLQRALARFAAAAAECRPAGRAELAYLSGRTAAYDRHLEALIAFTATFHAYAGAFARPADIPATRAALAGAVARARETEARARAAAEAFAACHRGPTDLAVTWMMNKPLHAARALRQHLENIAAYWDGRDYWAPVDWARLAAPSRHPTYRVEEVETLVLG